MSHCLFNFYAEYIMRDAGLEGAQAAIKIARRSINNLRYADDTTLMAESEEELKSLLMTVKVESEKVGFKLKIQKTKIMAFGPITSWEIDGQKVETVLTLIFWAPKSATDFLRMDWLDLLAVQGTATFCPITNISLFPPPLHPGNHYSTLCLYVFRFLRLYT